MNNVRGRWWIQGKFGEGNGSFMGRSCGGYQEYPACATVKSFADPSERIQEKEEKMMQVK